MDGAIAHSTLYFSLSFLLPFPEIEDASSSRLQPPMYRTYIYVARCASSMGRDSEASSEEQWRFIMICPGPLRERKWEREGER